MDLGACAKTHSQKLKGEYEAALARSQSDDPEESAETVSPSERTLISLMILMKQLQKKRQGLTDASHTLPQTDQSSQRDEKRV